MMNKKGDVPMNVVYAILLLILLAIAIYIISTMSLGSGPDIPTI